MKKNVLLSLLVLCLVGCSVKYIMIGPEYYHDYFEEKTVGVIIHDNKISIKYIGDVENEFGKGNTNELIKKYFYSAFPKHFQDSSIFSKVYMDSSYDQSNLKKVIVTHQSRNERERKFYMPDSGTIIHLNQGIPDFVLILQGLKITSLPSASVIMVGFTPIAAIPSKPVTYISRYVLWDNRKGEMAGWGSCQVSQATGVAVTLKTWHLATGKFVRHIISDKRIKHPPVNQLKILPLSENNKKIGTDCNIGCWSLSKSEPQVVCKNITRNEIDMNINGDIVTLKLDTINSRVVPTEELSYRDTITERYYSKYIKVRIFKITKSKCNNDTTNIFKYSGFLHVSYGDKKKRMNIRGVDICDN